MLSEQERKDDTRRKIILGGALLSYARNASDPDAVVAARLIERARTALTLPSHQSVFADWAIEDEPYHG